MSVLVNYVLIRSLHKRLPFCNVEIVFKTSIRFKNYFSFKDIDLNFYVPAKFIILRAKVAMFHILVKLLGT